MEILGFKIERIRKSNIPKKIKDSFTLDPDITKKGRAYLFGLQGTPFSTKKNQGYLHYDGIRIANDRVYFMWRGDSIVSRMIVGGCNGISLSLTGIHGKQKVDMS